MSALVILPILLLAGAHAGAAEAIDCSGLAYGHDLSTLALGRVSGTGKVNFAADASTKAGCPSVAPACRRPGFLLGGDQVAFDSEVRSGGFTCVTFIDGKGTESSGWLPTARLTPIPVAPAWAGHWKRNTSAVIDITTKPEGKAEVNGSATWGSGAATHDGGIDAVIDATEADQSFASDGDKQKPYDKAEKYDCAVRLKQLGPYLFVEDNTWCGGANVTFSGLYRKR